MPFLSHAGSTLNWPQPSRSGFPGGSDGKNLPTMRETLVRSLSLEDPLEKGKATRPSILVWRIPWRILGELQGGGAGGGYSSWGRIESDRTKWLT